jgi:hypothetical protein
MAAWQPVLTITQQGRIKRRPRSGQLAAFGGLAMRWFLMPICTVVITAGMAAAQATAVTEAPAPLPPFPGGDSLLLLPSPVADPKNLWDHHDGLVPGYHFTADIALEALWMHWNGSSSPAFGPNVSLGVFNEKGFGVGASWMQLEQSNSRSAIWGSRRP